MNKKKTGQSREQDGSAETLPRFSRADPRNHFMTPDQRTDGIRASIAELRNQDEIKQVVMAVHAWKEVNFLNEIEQPGDVHQAEQRRGDSEDTRRIAARKE